MSILKEVFIVLLIALSPLDAKAATFPYTVANPSPTSSYPEFLNHCQVDMYNTTTPLSNCSYYLVNPLYNTPVNSPFYGILNPVVPTPVPVPVPAPVPVPVPVPVAQTPIPAALWLFASPLMLLLARRKHG